MMDIRPCSDAMRCIFCALSRSAVSFYSVVASYYPGVASYYPRVALVFSAAVSVFSVAVSVFAAAVSAFAATVSIALAAVSCLASCQRNTFDFLRNPVLHLSRLGELQCSNM